MISSKVVELQEGARLVAARFGLTSAQVKAIVQLECTDSASWKLSTLKTGWVVQSSTPWIFPQRTVYDNLVRKGLVYSMCGPQRKSYALTVKGEKVAGDILLVLSIKKELESCG